MAKKRKHIKPAIKRKLIEEAGGKCANPGCKNWKVHIHHIKEWSVYETNDQEILIAVCPSCHDDIHHGSIEISDEVLYRWKKIVRDSKPNTTHLYIEPAQKLSIQTGSVTISSTNTNVNVFKLSDTNTFSFRIQDNDILLLNLQICNLNGDEVLRVSDNYVRVIDDDSIKFLQSAGHIKVSTDNINSHILQEFLNKMWRHEPNFAIDGELVLLDLEVIHPGLVKLSGCWSDFKHAVIISENSLSFIKKSLIGPISIVGFGNIIYSGPIEISMFGFKDDNTGAIKI
jgi:hypothetical protein